MQEYASIHKILYINSPKNDFLADSFLLGLKEIFGKNVYEFPANKFIYKSTHKDIQSMHGIGFTLYGILEPDECIEFNESMKIEDFDLVIFGDIYRQSDVYLKLFKNLNYKQTIILDGEDSPAIWPYYKAPWKAPFSLTYPKPHKRFNYFKREIVRKRTNYYRFYKFIPKVLCSLLSLPTIHPISFSIPDSKIKIGKTVKTKEFGKHIVDEELCQQIEGSMTKYAFSNEEDYYSDLQVSKFGITTKRGGWDCLRHYEIAANQAVICFKNLSLKPHECAPHGLINGVNCIEYSNYNDLIKKISHISEVEYNQLVKNSMDWVRNYSCKNLVLSIIKKHYELIESENTD
jgi:hypothetical protein